MPASMRSSCRSLKMFLVGAVRISRRTPGSLAQVAEQPRHEDLRHAGAHADGQRIRRRAAQPARRVGQAEHVADDALGLVQERAATLGHLDAARGAAEQRESDLLLEQPDLLADGGLGNAQARRSLGEAALLGDRQRIADLAELQHTPRVALTEKARKTVSPELARLHRSLRACFTMSNSHAPPFPADDWRFRHPSVSIRASRPSRLDRYAVEHLG